MGNLPKYCCCRIDSNNRDNTNLNKIPPKTSINLVEYNANNYSTEKKNNNNNNRIENNNFNDDKISNNSSISYDFFTPEEILEINDKIKNKYQKYQKMPLKSSAINIIYTSGLIE